MIFNVITLFPELIQAVHRAGVIGQALGQGRFQLNIVNPRDFTRDVHKTVDDRPYGGGDGMVLKPEPFAEALTSLPSRGRVVALTAQGETWNHRKARQWAESRETYTLLCGRYAGFDQRLLEEQVDEQVSIGDFIVSGGEWPACLLIDSVVRYLPGVLGNAQSAAQESFEERGLEGPQFTRPVEWQGLPVPEVLRSGDHSVIQKFRQHMALLTTLKHRRDLLEPSDKKSIEKALLLLGGLSCEEQAALGLKIEELNCEFSKWENSNAHF